MAEQECRGWISLFFFNFPGRIKKPFSAGVSQSEAGKGGGGGAGGGAGLGGKQSVCSRHWIGLGIVVNDCG